MIGTKRSGANANATAVCDSRPLFQAAETTQSVSDGIPTRSVGTSDRDKAVGCECECYRCMRLPTPFPSRGALQASLRLDLEPLEQLNLAGVVHIVHGDTQNDVDIARFSTRGNES